MAKIGALTVDLTLKSAEFIRDLNKSSQAVARSTESMNRSVKALAAGFGGLLSARLVKQIAGVTNESLKLAASMSGPLSDSARKFLVQFEELQTAFQLGIASGFLDGLNNGLLNTAENTKTATEAGRVFGRVLQFIAIDAGRFFGQELPSFLREVTTLWDELQRVALDFSQLLRGDLSVITGGVSSFAKSIPGSAEAEALAQYGSEAERAALATEQFWSATVTATAFGEEHLRTLNEQHKIMTALQTPAEAYVAALDRIAAAQLTGADASRAHTAATADLMGNYLMLADNVGTALGTMFQENKAVAIAQAVINTAQAVIKTFAEYGATPWGFALAASMAAIGAAQIAAIASANPGSGGGGRSKSLKASRGNSGGGGSAPSRAGAAATQAGAAGTSSSLNITLVGESGFSREQIRDLISHINSAVGDGAQLNVSTR